VPTDDPDDRPLVSVVVVTYNSERTVSETLSSLADQTYPHYEVIVVDGGSTDRTALIVADYDAEWVVADGATIGACRNRGIDRADGEYIAFTDSDCAVPATWLASHIARIQSRDDDSIVGVGGPNRPFPTDPPFAKLVGSLQGTIFGSGGSPQSHAIGTVRTVRSVACCNVLYDATLFESYRFEDTINVGEDAEFHSRVAQAGYRFLFDPEIAVSHHLSPTVGSYYRKNRSYGRAMAQVQCRQGRLVRWYSPLPSLALLGGSLAGLDDLRKRRARTIPILAAVFVLVSLYATAQVFRDRRSPLALLVPVMLAVQYLAYGLGFLEGLVASATGAR
jgi:succinoglycan biosynthesis protein ExoA